MRLRICLCMIFMFSVAFIFSTESEISYEKIDPASLELTFELGDFELQNIQIAGKVFTQIIFSGELRTKQKGYAALPYLHTALKLPDQKNFSSSIKITDSEVITLKHPLLPSRGTLYRDQDPSAVPYKISAASQKDELYPKKIHQTSDPFILRDIRGLNVFIHPFQYNAIKGELHIHKKGKIKLIENEENPINPLIQERSKITREMEALYRSAFINYSETRFENELEDHGSLLVIYTNRDSLAIAPYINWKREKGYIVYEEVVAAGTNVTNLVQDLYNTHNDILYVQLVGDWQDIQAPTSGSAPADPNLGLVVGTDFYPDLIVGRFSANSANEVTIQINKAIDYEKNTEAGEDWFETATGIASNQGPGDDNEMDNEHIEIIYDNKLDPFTYDFHNPIFDPSANPSMVADAVNNGTGIINYCGHGTTTSWSSSSFNNGHISNLSNGEQLPVIISVACVNGAFASTECFAEAWLHKENGGSVAMFASSINQSWDPPMRGQDYINDLLVGGYDYSLYPNQNGISTDVRKLTFGSLCFNGSILMTLEEPSGGLPILETWIVFGDATLDVRTATTQELSLSNTIITSNIDFNTTVTSDGEAVEGALVSLFQAGVSFTGTSDENGNVSISHDLEVGSAKLTVSAFNCETINEEIDVIPPGGAYLTVNDFIIDDSAGNNNGIVEHGEDITFDLSLLNLGTETAENVSAIITTQNQYVFLENITSQYPNIAPNELEYGNEQFSFSIDPYCPDAEDLELEIMINSATNSWEEVFTITSYAPILQTSNQIVIDSGGDGSLQPGESAELEISLINQGTGIAENITGILYTDDDLVSINQNSAEIAALQNGETAFFDETFAFSISTDCPPIHNIRFNLLLSEALGYYQILQLDINVGFFDNVEYGENGWTHLSLNVGSDEWHQSENRCFSETHSWKVGSTTTGTYGNNLICALESPELDISSDGYLTFRHWLQAETSASYPDECYDGGLLEIFYNDVWTQITPESGYPYITRGDNNPPFANATPVYSGEIDWERAYFDLSDYDGIIKIRFVFGSDGAVAEEGWYIDDIAIVDETMMLQPPTNLTAENVEPIEAENLLNWEAPSTNPLSYNVYYRTQLDDPYLFLSNVNETYFMHSNLMEDIYYYVVTALYQEGESRFSNPAQTYTNATDSIEQIISSKMSLMNYPNPFNPTTMIQFSIKESSEITTLEIFNIRGQQVRTLIDEKLEAGKHEIFWDGKDKNAKAVASGLYFSRLKNGKNIAVQKMLLLK